MGNKLWINDSVFFVPGEEKETTVPNGVAHFLEHKLFEQENGTNSLDVLTSLGVNANAYTTNDHTAYLFEGTNNFYEAMDELMDYVQHPYFTDENVEKEKGIIGQEIRMYDDNPDWIVYLNAIKAMYHNNPIKIDITGTIETIEKIDKEILYKCYNTFYSPSNMLLIIAGDFEPDAILEEVKKRLIDKKSKGTIKRVYPEEPDEIAQKRIEQKLEVSRPLYAIGIKDKVMDSGLENKNEIIKKHLGVAMLLNLLVGTSSSLFQSLYKDGIMLTPPTIDYEFGKTYAHILVMGQSGNPDLIYEEFKKEVENLKQNGIKEEDFNRIKKMFYGNYIKQYNDIVDISRIVISDYFKGINSFDYLDEIETINVEYLEQLLKDVFKEEKMVISIVKN